ncbi:MULTISPECIES: ABC transporter substrate-binding protein [unclassified Rhodanobacter]|nr:MULTISPECIES: ABC transporter substrate-binding protein [unclassified Rhodanobacter]
MRLPSLLLLLSLLLASPGHAADMHIVHDMAGDAVSVPVHVDRVVTLGATPVINSLLFAVGAGDRIINGLGTFGRQGRWNYQYSFAPRLASLPPLANLDRSANLEALLQAAPDVVLTMDRSTAQSLRRAGLLALYMAWRQPEDVKVVVNLLGDLLERPVAAARYTARFDSLLDEVGDRLRGKNIRRPSVLYFSPKTLTQPHLIVEWWIRAAGGESVTDNHRRTESYSFGMEQLLAWNPQFLIVSSPEEAVGVRTDPRFAKLRAVREGHVLIAPCGAHTWGNRTSEQPLMVLWAAQQFHPSLFTDVDMIERSQRFYREIYGTTLTHAQVAEILAGGPRRATPTQQTQTATQGVMP